jgi:hypothetical protein
MSLRASDEIRVKRVPLYKQYSNDRRRSCQDHNKFEGHLKIFLGADDIAR